MSANAAAGRPLTAYRSNFGFHPPDTSTPGRPGYGGTCFSDILSQIVTQYDNISSSGVMLFSTTGQAYAHPIDGFALETPASVTSVSIFCLQVKNVTLTRMSENHGD